MTKNSLLDLEMQKRVDAWLTGPYDKDTKATIQSMIKNDPEALKDAFYANLSFGTGGMRGLMGVGTTRMNLYTVRIATQGLANYLNKQPKTRDRHYVFIGFDSRHHSQEFAQTAAEVLAANQIGVYLLPELRPTPFISFGTRQKQCSAGIMITASHNPKQYNGYKVYWSDGGQVVAPHDKGIVQEVNAIQSIDQVKIVPLNHPLIEILDLSLDLDYLSAIHKLPLNAAENKKVGNALKISYTPLHGTGIKLVPRALKDWGFTNIHLVGAQIVPDGNFPTVKSPNPEYKETLEMGIQDLLAMQSDVLIATDPDADRMAVTVLHQGKAEILNGNEIASICAEYICSTLKQQNRMPKNGAIVTTIVSSDLIPAIAKKQNVACIEVLTGFKYIGEMIHQWETSKEYTFLFGAEESYGYLIGTHSRDKDAVVSSCLIAEIALLKKVEGKTLVDFLHEIYQRYGIYREKQLTIDFKPGIEGMNEMKILMDKLRQHPPASLLGSSLEVLEDYETKERLFIETKQKQTLTLPKSNVLLLQFKDESKLVIRPSGTEPKLKFYARVRKKEFSSIKEGVKAADDQLDALLNAAKQLLS